MNNLTFTLNILLNTLLASTTEGDRHLHFIYGLVGLVFTASVIVEKFENRSSHNFDVT